MDSFIFDNVEIKHRDYCNCAQDVFITLLQYYKKDHIKIFDHAWSFNYKNNARLEVSVYRDDNFTQLFNSLQANYGIDMVLGEKGDISKAIYAIQENSPPVLLIDTYYCKWHKSYQKIHNKHFVILAGYNKNNFYCIDPYYSKNIEIVSFIDYINLAIKIFYPNQLNTSYFQWKQNISTHLLLMLKGVDDVSDFEQMCLFADELKNKDQLIFDIHNYPQIVFYPLLLELNSVGFGRMCYAEYLSFLTKKYEIVMPDQISHIKEIATKWLMISPLLIKCISKDFPDEILNRVYSLLASISKEEEEIAYSLNSML